MYLLHISAVHPKEHWIELLCVDMPQFIYPFCWWLSELFLVWGLYESHCLPQNLYAIKKQQLEPDMEQRTGSKLGKEYIKAVYCHPAYLTYMQSTSCKMLGWMKHKLKSRLLGEISVTQICRWHYPYGRKQREIKPLDEGERGEWKSWLKTRHSKNEDHGIQSHHYMANRWGNNRNSNRLYFLGL